MEVRIFLLAFFVIFSANCVNSKRILITHPSPSQSHVIPVQILAKLLAERGHEITLISAFPLNKDGKIKNFRDIKIEVDEGDKSETMKEMLKNPGSAFSLTAMKQMPAMITKAGNSSLQSIEVRKMMKDEKFDLVIVGYFFSEFLLGLGDHFKCPTVVVSSMGLFSTLAWMTGNPLGIPAVSHIAFPMKGNSFFERLATLLMYTMEAPIAKFLFDSLSKEVYNYNFPQPQYRSYEDSIKNVSLLLLNTHFSTTGPRAYVNNVIEVGGLQVKSTPSPLPENIKNFLDSARHGAILFSFGSNVKSNYLPDEKIKILLNVFSKVKQRVVMKWESDELKGKPDNVLISKWLPQDDVLAHKNIKAFISHCGYGGLIEAKFHGVPIIGVPIFGDQPGNADKIVMDGWGIKIDLKDLTEELLLNAINEITTNSTYSTKVKKLSELSKDRPQSPQETAIYWVEYVLRHHGAPHLHYPAADLNFFQDNSIDLIAFLLIVFYAIYRIIKFVIKKMLRLCCRRGGSKLKAN